jgi:catechol 2,3-dioxygenase-like lactoylglutathione lyase family enzyme
VIDHIAIQCSDLQRAARFYDTLLAVIGGRRIIDRGDPIGYGTEFPCFWLGTQTTGNEREAHIAFKAPTRNAVDEFYATAQRLNAIVLHEPRVWPEYHPGYYGTFVRDPDGNNIEAVHHTLTQ